MKQQRLPMLMQGRSLLFFNWGCLPNGRHEKRLHLKMKSFSAGADNRS